MKQVAVASFRSEEDIKTELMLTFEHKKNTDYKSDP